MKLPNAAAGRRWLRRAGIAAVVLAASSVTALPSAVAHATTAPRPHAAASALAKTVAPSAGPAAIRLTAGAAHATVSKPALSIISCTLQVNDPHKSGHVPGTINVTATIQCSQAVTALYIAVRLYYISSNGNEYEVASGSNSNSGKSFIQGNAATSCFNGTFAADANGTITSPPGYSPPGTNPVGPVFSRSVNITC
jgi:hypothetical protein